MVFADAAFQLSDEGIPPPLAARILNVKVIVTAFAMSEALSKNLGNLLNGLAICFM